MASLVAMVDATDSSFEMGIASFGAAAIADGVVAVTVVVAFAYGTTTFGFPRDTAVAVTPLILAADMAAASSGVGLIMVGFAGDVDTSPFTAGVVTVFTDDAGQADLLSAALSMGLDIIWTEFGWVETLVVINLAIEVASIGLVIAVALTEVAVVVTVIALDAGVALI